MPTTDEVQYPAEGGRTCLTPTVSANGRRWRDHTAGQVRSDHQDPGAGPGCDPAGRGRQDQGPAGPGRRPADDHRLRPPGPRRQRRRRPAAGHGQPRRPARAAADRAVPPRRRRAARQPGHHRGPAAARRARGQGRVRVDEPRRPAGRLLRARRPVHRLRRPGHRRHGIQRRQDPDPGRPGRSRHAEHPDRNRHGHQ